jgi:hypothetical protein
MKYGTILSWREKFQLEGINIAYFPKALQYIGFDRYSRKFLYKYVVLPGEYNIYNKDYVYKTSLPPKSLAERHSYKIYPNLVDYKLDDFLKNNPME